MKHFIIFILSMVLIGCNRQKVNIEVDINDYNLLLPNNWSKINLNSPDAIIYAITDRIDTIIIHSGMNIGEFTDLQNLEESYDTLDLHIIQMIKPKTNDIGMWGLYLGGGTVKNKLSIIALIHNKENVFITKEVFASLKIKTDCISICNEDVIGEIIYKRQCFNCHGDFNVGFGGVSLLNLTKSKSIDWIRNWIKSEGFRKSNKANSYESFEGLKDMNCTVPVIGIQEQESLVLYLNSHK